MSDTNYWLDDSCARAFWDQHKAVPYQELLEDTGRWLDPKPGESWLDLGCGGGQLTAMLWHKSGGQVKEIVGMDCAAANAEVYARLNYKLKPKPEPDQVKFVVGNLSEGLGAFADDSFDGVVSGLAISYAEHQDPQTGHFTDHAYNHILAEIHRVLKPGGQLAFSVNVPEPKFSRIFWKSLGQALWTSKPAKLLVNGWKMQSYGRWLKREARRGRFHFLPFSEIWPRMQRIGYEGMRCRLSYADQAYIIGAQKPGVAGTQAA